MRSNTKTYSLDAHLYRQNQRDRKVERKLDLTDTIKDGARLFFIDEGIRRQLLLALTEDSKLHIEEVCHDYTYDPFLSHKAHNLVLENSDRESMGYV